MPTLTIGDKSVTVGDDFLKLSPEQQSATVDDIAKSLGASNPAPVTATNVARSAAGGVPIVGGALNQLEAATNATLAPVLNPLFAEKDQLKGSWSERRAESLRQQNAIDDKFAADHPVIDTGARVVGGVAGTIPAMAAAPAAFGLTGTLPQMVARGAASNAILGGADAAVRGEDINNAAAVGAGLGATLPLAARGVGKLAQAVRDYRNPVAPVAQRAEDVAGVKIPLTKGQATADPAAQAEEEIFRRGGGGSSAEAIARQADDEAKAAIGQASDNIAANLDPTAQTPRTGPQGAAEAVSTELQAQQAAKAAAEAQQAAKVAAEGNSLSQGLGGGAAPASPFDAAEGVGAAVTRARDAAKADYNAKYAAYQETPGVLDRSVPANLANDIRTRANTGSDPIWVDPTNESIANSALKELDNTVKGGIFRNHALPQEADAIVKARVDANKLSDTLTEQGIHPEKAKDAAAKAFNLTPEQMAGPTVPDVDLRTLENARKRLTAKFSDAKAKALNGGGSSDLRAMGRILNEFDGVVDDAFASGKFSGDSEAAQRLQAEARKSYSSYRNAFTSRGGGDETGRAIEKILGRYTDSAASGDDILKMSFGSRAAPGGGKEARVNARLRDILGADSPEWKRHQQNFFEYVTKAPPGEKAFTPADVATRIDRVLTGDKQGLANTVWSPADRVQITNYANSLKGLPQTGKASNKLEQELARITGADGQIPASPNEVADMLFNRNGSGRDGVSVMLAKHLKPKASGAGLTPDGWTAVRQGAWEKLVTPGEGMTEYGTQKLSQRLHGFLFGDGKYLAETLFSPEERAEMAKLAAVYKKITPLRGTTNPSGTAPMLAKIANKASSNILALIGLGTHGVTGAITGHAVQSIGKTVREARQGQRAVELFFGEQPKRISKATRIAPVAGAATIAGPTSQRR